MKIVIAGFGWVLGLCCLELMVLSFMAGHYLSSLCALIMMIILVPLFRKWFWEYTGFKIPVWLQIILVPVCFFLFVTLILITLGNKYSIYENTEIEKKITNIYNNHLAQWNPENQTSYITTQYGKVHVIASGKPEYPPLLLLHASSMASWSWLYNVDGLNKFYRTYAIDTIGDAGRSSLADMDVYPQNGEQLAALYEEIMDSLKVEKASVIGASQGGYIATNLALYAPDRVDKLILCGPLGYTSTLRSVLRIIFTTMFPLKPIQENATHWAFGNNPKVLAEVSDWFYTVLDGVISQQARPKAFTDEQLKSLKMPVLLLLGTHDGLVGNPKHARKRVANLPDFQTSELNTGHLISVEKPKQFNRMVLQFLMDGCRKE